MDIAHSKPDRITQSRLKLRRELTAWLSAHNRLMATIKASAIGDSDLAMALVMLHDTSAHDMIGSVTYIDSKLAAMQQTDRTNRRRSDPT